MNKQQAELQTKASDVQINQEISKNQQTTS
jgi:hypothetical protein